MRWLNICATSSGPSCSKLTMSLVNVLLKFQMLKYLIYANIFLLQRSFCIVKASFIISTKIISIFSNKVEKHLTSCPLNELFKLTMPRTTGPRSNAVYEVNFFVVVNFVILK